MPTIPLSGLGPRHPWSEGQVVSPMAATVSAAWYGKFDISGAIAFGLYGFWYGNRIKKQTDANGKPEYVIMPERPPTYEPFVPFVQESDTIPDHVVSAAFRNALLDARMKGYKVRFEDPGEVYRKSGSDACEYREWFNGREHQVIEIADGLQYTLEGLKRIAHERYAADRFRGLQRVNGDHEAIHDEIKEATEIEAARYIADAMRAH